MANYDVNSLKIEIQKNLRRGKYTFWIFTIISLGLVGYLVNYFLITYKDIKEQNVLLEGANDKLRKEVYFYKLEKKAISFINTKRTDSCLIVFDKILRIKNAPLELVRIGKYIQINEKKLIEPSSENLQMWNYINTKLEEYLCDTDVHNYRETN